MLGPALRARLDGTAAHKLYRYAVEPQYRYARKVASEIIATIPRQEFDAIRRKYLVEDPGAPGSMIVHTGTRKYLDERKWIENAVERALTVGLHTRGPLSILDLGCGVPYFLLVARHFGHRGVGVDLDENRMFNELTQLFGIERVAHRIVPFQRLPEFGRRFDLITSYMSYFNFYFANDRPRAWTADEWRFFFDDIRSRLNPGGRARIELNRGGFYLMEGERGVYLTDTTAAALSSIPGVQIAPMRHLITLEGAA
jgi:SAM-dependent methyltransferase